jgi:hypothetical protein
MGVPNRRDKTYFSPEALALAQQAFEQIWTKIEPRFAASRHAEVRGILAAAVMEAVRVDSNNIEILCRAGLQMLERMYPVEMHMRLRTSRGDTTANDSGRKEL